jgi:hypothetical protein
MRLSGTQHALTDHRPGLLISTRVKAARAPGAGRRNIYDLREGEVNACSPLVLRGMIGLSG